MSFQLPHKAHTGSKWLTATLISVYIIIAMLVVLYSVSPGSSGNNNNGNTATEQPFAGSRQPALN